MTTKYTQKLLALLMALVLVAGFLPVPKAHAAEVGLQRELTAADAGRTLSSGLYYVKSDLMLNRDKSAYNGLALAEGATVYLHIPAGVTLSVYGGDGTDAAPGGDAVRGSIHFAIESDDGWQRYVSSPATESSNGAKGASATGGGAAIYVPQGATLYVIGEGTLSATGGKGGDAGQGGKGATTTTSSVSNYQIINDSGSKKLIAYLDGQDVTASCGYTTANIERVHSGVEYRSCDYTEAAAGAGGNGGGGAAGGGAGIGANGASGAEANFGGRAGVYEESNSYTNISGATNSTTAALSCGTVQIASTITKSLNGGAGGNVGTMGEGGRPKPENQRFAYYI